MSETDQALYVRWPGGNASAGDELAQRHCAPVLRFFSSKVPAAAEDLMQKTFLACMSAKTDPAEVRSFRGLLFGIARKQLLRHFEGRGELEGEEMLSHISLAALQTTPTQPQPGRRLGTAAPLRAFLDAYLSMHVCKNSPR